MASTEQVRQYLSYWFQLGKPVVIDHGNASVLPRPVLQGDRYSDAFEQCWQRLLASDLDSCYLEGTEQSLSELLEPGWELPACARCNMPIPVPTLGITPLSCPCNDLPFWPDTELPQPRSPVDSHARLNQIRDRLQQRKS